MSNGKGSRLWTVNVISFLLLIVLSSTGLINWLLLPKGYEARRTALVSLRHFFVTIHEWAGLAFIIVVTIHIVLHWPYIKSNLKKFGIMK